MLFESISKIQVFSLIGSIVFLAVILEFVRRERLKEAYSLLWLVLGVGFIILAAVPGLLGLVKYVGIVYAPTALLLFLILGIIMILIQYSVVLSNRAEQIKVLTQELALLRHNLEKLEKVSAKQKSDKSTQL